ncbi:MAG TPA: GNAT family N-acetyltransferase [Pirellulales bacterium]|nr:GNAT family N-acetyltransferase [Pirellulales bacterium]
MRKTAFLIHASSRDVADVTEINDLDELAGYRPHWRSLLTNTHRASFFHTLDWLEAYWRHFGSGQRLRVLIVRSEGLVRGIVPLVVRTEPTRLGRVRVLTYPLDYWGMFYGPIGPQPTAALSAAMIHVAQTRRDWDLIDLRWIDREGCDALRALSDSRLAGWQPRERVGEQGAVIELGDSWESYWSSRGHRWRNNVGRCERKLAALGEVAYIRYRPVGADCDDDEPRWDLYSSCETIAGRSWQGSSTTGTTLTHGPVRDYLRDAFAAAARAGGVDLNLLRLDGRAVAFAYCFHLQGHVFGLRMGYDSSVTDVGAGTVLMRRMVEDSFARGDRIFDLGPGYLECKRPWLTSIATSYRCRQYSGASPRAQALRLKDCLFLFPRSAWEHIFGRSAAPRRPSAAGHRGAERPRKHSHAERGNELTGG